MPDFLSQLLSFGTSATAHRAYHDLTNGRYLTALQRLREAHVSPEQTPLAANFLLWALNAVDPWNSAWSLSGAGRQPPVGIGDLIEPEGAIASALSRHRVVVLMESHRAPETRYFGCRLLRALTAAGATHLAFETAQQSTINRFLRTGIARPNSEVYAFDPSRACLLRTARELGLRLVAFDFPPEGYLRDTVARLLGKRPSDPETVNRDRERNMAENIVRLILRQDPAARVVVWTGEQHAMKRTPPDWPWQHPFMAAHLTRMTGEEPFCVWQECVNWPALSAGTRLSTGDYQWLRDRGVDAVILHHRGDTPARPAWIDEGTTSVDLPFEGADLVQAIPAAEGDRAVPVAQWLTHGQPLGVRIAPGRYLLRGLRAGDEVAWQREVVVS